MYKKLIICFILAFAISISIINISAEKENEVVLTDTVTDGTYYVNITDTYININGLTDYPLNIKNALTCSVCNEVITFYAPDEYNNKLSVYVYTYKSESLKSFSIPCNALYNPLCFTSDINKNIYFASADNSHILMIYSNGNIGSVTLNSYIKQIISLDETSVLIVTEIDSYIYNNETLTELDFNISDIPVRYSGKNIFTDKKDNQYFYENGLLSLPKIETTAQSTIAETVKPKPDKNKEDINEGKNDKPTSSQITTKPKPESETTEAVTSTPPKSEEYKIINGKYIIVPQGTTISKIKKNLVNFEIIKATRFDEKLIKSGKVGTGTTLHLANGKTLTVIIYGELTGEGNINSRDIKAILNHLSEKTLLKGNMLIAADIDTDGFVTTKDALKTANLY